MTKVLELLNRKCYVTSAVFKGHYLRPKTLQKDTIQLSYMSFNTFCDMSLITACAIFCSLKFHVVCTCTFFGDTICLLRNRKMIKIVSLIDLHVVMTYDYTF